VNRFAFGGTGRNRTGIDTDMSRGPYLMMRCSARAASPPHYRVAHTTKDAMAAESGTATAPQAITTSRHSARRRTLSRKRAHSLLG
jgi:hypothetical protein